MRPSPLRQAIERGDLAAVRRALLDGADLEEADIHGKRGLPLRLACFHGHLAIVRELLELGADLNADNGEGPGAPLRMAQRGGHTEIIALLRDYGAQARQMTTSNVLTHFDRRLHGERRRAAGAPPHGMRERRQHEDRRGTSIREVSLSATQWADLFGSRLRGN
ncbi:ankyrin repeat domain-containing protein [Zoogloea sp.]|uniref:ankyrin repeat domain-containing protein n=1 Tax=Zoogloea sp. TaxID=49181 RepID=UPI0035AFD04D